MKFIIDTNVLIVANGDQSEQATIQCQLNCVRQLNAIRQNHQVVLDRQELILREYMRDMNFSGQPGMGDFFFKWLFDNRFRSKYVELVSLTPMDNSEDGNDFVEFPTDTELAKFDRSDRKFVAVALAHAEKPPILNATDSDWWEFYEPLTIHGLQIEFLCKEGKRE